MTDSAPTPTSRIHDVYGDRSLPAWKRYALLAVGTASIGRLVLYELVTGCFGRLPGMAGYWLRRRTYRWILGGMGRNVTLGRNLTLRGGSRIHLGDDVHIDDQCVLDARGETASIAVGNGVLIARNTIVRARDGQVTIGDGSDVGCNCILGTDSRLAVGRKVLIAAYAYLVAGGNHVFDDPGKPVIDQGTVSRGGIEVGDGGWIGARVTVLDGVTIGEGVVVGSHALVTRDMPPRSIVHGTPAQVVRERGAAP